MNLGIIYKNGKIINHRSLLKVAINPFLRLIGLQFATLYDNNTLGKCIITRCPRRSLKFSWYYPLDSDEIVVRERIII